MSKSYVAGSLIIITKYEPALNMTECAGLVLKSFDADALLKLWAKHNGVERGEELHVSAVGTEFWQWLINNEYIRRLPVNVLHTGNNDGLELTDAGTYGV